MGGLAGLLAVAFTTALSGGQDPDYAMHPFDLEVNRQVASGLDCEQLNTAFKLLDEPAISSDDWRFRRDLQRARRILDCGE